MSSYQDYLNHIILDIDNSNNLIIQYLDEDDNLIETFYIDSSHDDVSLNTNDISYDHQVDICMNASVFNRLFLFYPSVGLGHGTNELSKMEYAIDHTQWKHVDFSSLMLQNETKDIKTHFLYYMIQQFYGNRQDVDVVRLVKNKSELLTNIQSYDSTYNQEIVKHLKTMGSMFEPENNENNTSNYLLRSYITISKQNSDRKLAFLENVNTEFEKNKKKFIRLHFQENDVVSLILVYESSATITQRYKINFIMEKEETKTMLNVPFQSTLTISGDYFVVNTNAILDASNIAHQFLLHEGNYIIQYDDSANPITFLNHGKENMIRVYADEDKTTSSMLTLDDASYNFYWGTMYVNVHGDFNYTSLCTFNGSTLLNGYQFLTFDSSYTAATSTQQTSNVWKHYGSPNRVYGDSANHEQHFGKMIRVNDSGNVFYASVYDVSQQNQCIQQYTFDVFHEVWNKSATLCDADVSSNAAFGSTFCLYKQYLFVCNQSVLQLYQIEDANISLLNTLDLSASCIDNCLVANNNLVAFCLSNQDFYIYSYSFSSFTLRVQSTVFPNGVLTGMTSNYSNMDSFMFIDASYNTKHYTYSDASLVEDVSKAISNPYDLDGLSNVTPAHSGLLSMDLSGDNVVIGYPHYDNHRGIVHVYSEGNNDSWDLDLSLCGYDLSFHFFGNQVKLSEDGEFLCVANGSLNYDYDSTTHAYSNLRSYTKSGVGSESSWSSFGDHITFYENPRQNIIGFLDFNKAGNVLVYSDPQYTHSNAYVYDSSYMAVYKDLSSLNGNTQQGLVTCVIQAYEDMFYSSYDSAMWRDISLDNFFDLRNFGYNSFIYPYKTLFEDASHTIFTPYIGSNVSLTPMGTKLFANHAILSGVSGENQPLYCYKYYFELDTWYPNAHYDLSSSAPLFVDHDVCNNRMLLYNGIVNDSACKHDHSPLACAFDGSRVVSYQQTQYAYYAQESSSFLWTLQQNIETNDNQANMYLSADGNSSAYQVDSSLCFYEDLSLVWCESVSTFYNETTHTNFQWKMCPDFTTLFVGADGSGANTGFVSSYDVCFNTQTVNSKGLVHDVSNSIAGSLACSFDGAMVAFCDHDVSNQALIYVYQYDDTSNQWNVRGGAISFVYGPIRIHVHLNYFGSMLFVSQVNQTTNRGKIHVYVYHHELALWTLYYEKDEAIVESAKKDNLVNEIITSQTNASWGHGLSTNSNGQIVALGAPYFSPSGFTSSHCGVVGVFEFV
tara:strand:- start:95 stop:3781 length:3687 start_codon:yes stop_codon:yes gene_type:complete